MPVWKFRSVEDMPPTPCYEPGSERHLARWEALWARASALAQKRFRSGVSRYRSVEESQRHSVEANEAVDGLPWDHPRDRERRD